MSVFTVLFSFKAYVGAGCLGMVAYHLVRYPAQERATAMVSRRLFWGFVIFILLRVGWWWGAQYTLWRAHPSAQYFLPPYQPLSYFLSYGWFRFARPEAVGMAVALFFFFLFLVLQRVSRGRMFYLDEQYSAGIALLANAWPQNLLLIPLVLCVGALLRGASLVMPWRRAPQGARTSLRLLWPLCGIVLVFLGDWLVQTIGLSSLRL